MADELPQLEAAVLRGHTNLVQSVCVVPTRDRGAVLASSGMDHSVRFWDPVTRVGYGEVVEVHRGLVGALCTVQIENRLVLASADVVIGAGSAAATICLWDPATATLLEQPIATDGVVEMCAIPVGNRQLLATANSVGTVQLLDPVTSRSVGPSFRVAEVLAGLCVVSVSGMAVLASVDRSGEMGLWDPRNGQRMAPRFRTGRFSGGHRGDVWALCAMQSASGTLLATAGSDASIRLWDVMTARSASSPLRGHAGQVTCLSPVVVGGTLLIASGGVDATVRLWDPTTKQQVGEPLVGHTDTVRAVCALPIGGATYLATVGHDMTVRLWGPAMAPEAAQPTTASAAAGRSSDQRMSHESNGDAGPDHGDVADWLAAFGRASASDALDWNEVGATVAALYHRWSERPEGFVDYLAAQAMPAGGWAVYGAHKVAREILSEPPLNDSYIDLFRAAMQFARSQGIPRTWAEVDLLMDLEDRD